MRRRSGHESSADWLTATEQQDKNVAAAYSCLFHPSVPSFCSVLFCSLWFCSILSGFCPLFYSLVSPVLSSIRSIGLLFSRPYSLTLTVRAVVLFTALLSTHLLRDATVFIFVDRPPCLLQEFSSRPRVLLRLSSSRRPTYPRARRRLPIFESIRAACRPRRHISSRTPVRPDYSHQVPRGCCDFSNTPAPFQCESIGSLSLVAPTAILIKSLPTVLFCLLRACVGLWVAVFFLFVFFSLAPPAEPAGHARSYFLHIYFP